MQIEGVQFGKVTMRKCPACGHHEVGYVTETGRFYPLRQGDQIQIVQKPSPPGLPGDGLKQDAATAVPEAAVATDRIAWIAEPLKQNLALRLKYGVLMAPRFLQEPMNGDAYDRAFRQKVADLIEKEQFLPLPVLLDRFFSAPHLAAGETDDIVNALFEAIDEIREPVVRMRAWLHAPSEETLKKLMHPFSDKVSADELNGEVSLRQALDSLTLEEFFELL